ncbi:MAG: asparaginase [Rhodoferax sp.]|nr:asparaginase [Rhodoferax sp.]MDO9196737.1 asparaginase [Rhodoferax sp.]
MQVTSTSIFEKIVVLGTGGTIAGTAASGADNIGYTAAQVEVAQLLEAIPGLSSVLAGRTLVTEQITQIDSKDMSFAVWQQLALRVSFHLAQADVKGVVITHGTDTLEETAYFLHAVLPTSQRASKPVVLTCAMRPASSLTPDGPQNVMDAVAVAIAAGACGVVAVCAGTIHGAVEVQKVHPYRLDAFSSGEAGPVGYVEEGCVRLVKNWPLAPAEYAQTAIEKIADVHDWPCVEIVMNYAGASGALVDALLSKDGVQRTPASPVVRGLVVAATGNGTVHRDLEAALLRAQAAGVKVVLATRCINGRLLPALSATFPDSQGLSPVKARVALMLALLP